MRGGGGARRKRNERKDEWSPEEGGRLGAEGVEIVEGERVVGEDSRDGLFDLRSRLPPSRSLFFFFPSSLSLSSSLIFFYHMDREEGTFAGSMEKN